MRDEWGESEYVGGDGAGLCDAEKEVTDERDVKIATDGVEWPLQEDRNVQGPVPHVDGHGNHACEQGSAGERSNIPFAFSAKRG